jgi:hypothetical protein
MLAFLMIVIRLLHVSIALGSSLYPTTIVNFVRVIVICVWIETPVHNVVQGSFWRMAPVLPAHLVALHALLIKTAIVVQMAITRSMMMGR